MPATLIALGRVAPGALFIDREVAVMDLGRVVLNVENLIVRMLGWAAIFLFEHGGVLALHGIAILVVTPIIGHLIDEEGAQDLDLQRCETLLLVEVLFNGATDHEPHQSICIDVADRLAGA